MGPRHYSRGNPTVKSIICLSIFGFNGATTLQSWKLSGGLDKYIAQIISMGPRHYSRGNEARIQAIAPLAEFQWGHDITVVETLSFEGEATTPSS